MNATRMLEAAAASSARPAESADIRVDAKENGDDIEDALVAWWHARTMLEAAEARLPQGTFSIEHIKAQRIETAARTALYETIETYLSLAAVKPEHVRRIDPFRIVGIATELSEAPAEPPAPPARSVT